MGDRGESRETEGGGETGEETPLSTPHNQFLLLQCGNNAVFRKEKHSHMTIYINYKSMSYLIQSTIKRQFSEIGILDNE